MTELERTQKKYLLVDASLASYAVVTLVDLSSEIERHYIDLEFDTVSWIVLSEGGIEQAVVANGCNGVLLQQFVGFIGKSMLNQGKTLLQKNIKSWFYWPQESVVERVTQVSLKFHMQYRFGLSIVRGISCYQRAKRQIVYKVKRLLSRTKLFINLSLILLTRPSLVPQRYLEYKSYQVCEAQKERFETTELAEANSTLNAFIESGTHWQSLDSQALKTALGGHKKFKLGIYLRLDFWANIDSGGSYGHTCYVAKELSEYCDDFLVVNIHPYALLDELGIKQFQLPQLGDCIEENFIRSTSFYYPYLRSLIAYLQPDFIYERLVIGNYAGAKVARDLAIPYIVEYNGSELEMRRSYDSAPYQYEALYCATQKAAFLQATLVSTISTVIAGEVAAYGVDANKILVNPNAADPVAYKPATITQKKKLRQGLGFDAEDVVIGFVGTFGGWHGIESLAEVLPQACQLDARVKFLLIGDGNYKELVDTTVDKFQLGKQVVMTGAVAQAKAAELMKVCDIFLSPHSGHMKSMPFFGSPTKVFEYMALGGGIIASDLMQIGEILQPALNADQLTGDITADDQCAILCEPGNASHIVQAIKYLLEHDGVTKLLGKNARVKLLKEHTWQQHVEKIWHYLDYKQINAYAVASDVDEYKVSAKQQWDNDPCGSHYVKREQKDLAWFDEAAQYHFQNYAPWKFDLINFDQYANKSVLEIGAGMGMDLVQFAQHGAQVTDLDLSEGHLEHAKLNFKLRGLNGEFKVGDAESMPFETNKFDIVYTNGVLHHVPHTQKAIDEIYRVLKPGGQVIAMFYARHSWFFWHWQFYKYWFLSGAYEKESIGDVMSAKVEISNTGAKPLVKVYSARELRKMFGAYQGVHIYKRQLTRDEYQQMSFKYLPFKLVERLMGWNLIVKAKKPWEQL